MSIFAKLLAVFLVAHKICMHFSFFFFYFPVYINIMLSSEQENSWYISYMFACIG
jgi:hypothetical protein